MRPETREFYRALAWSYGWAVGVSSLATWAWGNVFVSIVVGVVVFITALKLVSGRWVRYWWLEWKHADLLSRPPVLDEDGKLQVPVLLPGDSVDTEFDAWTGRPIVSRVVDRRGRVRSEWKAPR